MPQPLKLKDWCLIGSLAFGLGLAAPHIRTWLSTHSAPTEQPDETATAPISSDSFSLKLLHAALQSTPEGNLLLLPDCLAALLQQIKYQASDEVATELAGIAPPEQWQRSSSDIRGAACLFADVPYSAEAEAQGVISTPYSQNPAIAIATINNTLQAYTSRTLGQMITGDDISPDTTAIAAIAFTCTAEWAAPIRQADSKAADFYNANGSIPRILFMQAQAQHYAEAPSGEWKAACIRLAGTRTPAGIPPCDLIVIMPGHHSARPFAAALTQEQFSTIRTALREAPANGSIEIPRLEFGGPAQNLRPLLQQIGQEKLLTSSVPFSKLTSKEPFALSTMLAKYHIALKETRQPDAAPANDSPALLRCDKPFLWFLMPLSSPHAPYAMGIVENL